MQVILTPGDMGLRRGVHTNPFTITYYSPLDSYISISKYALYICSIPFPIPYAKRTALSSISFYYTKKKTLVIQGVPSISTSIAASI